jgi:hypothetical protein
LVVRDVQRGRKDLNFSEWYNLALKKREIKKEEIIEEISLDLMPMPIYLLTHPSAKLSREEKITIKNRLKGYKTSETN